LLQKKCEYHRTCCDYLVAAACHDRILHETREKNLQHFYQLVVNMVWDLWKSYARTFRCLALLRWEKTSGKGAMWAIVAATFIVLCWTLNLHLCVLLGSSKKITRRDHWITTFSQINGCYSSRCHSWLTKALRYRAVWRLPSANVYEAGLITKCKCFWSSRQGGSSSCLLLKIKQFCSS